MNIFEFQIAPEKLYLYQREITFLNRVYWENAVCAEYQERENGLIPATMTVNFPSIGEYQIVGWVHHTKDLAAIPLHSEQALDMNDHIESRICDLWGHKQSRNETWILIDRDGVMLCCGPAGAKTYDIDRYKLEVARDWLRHLAGVVGRYWGASEITPPTPLTDYLAAVSASIRQHGFIPKSMRDSEMLRDTGLQPTYFHALMAIRSTPKAGQFDIEEPLTLDITDHDRAIAGKAIEFVRSWDMSLSDNNRDEFKPLLFKAASENVLQQGIEAAAAFSVVEYLQSQSTHLVTDNRVVELHLTPIMKTWMQKGGVLYKFVTNDSNVLVWFADGYSEWMKPGVYRVRIKKLDTYNGIAQTQVDVLDVEELARKLWTIEIEQEGDRWGYTIYKKGHRVTGSGFIYEEYSRCSTQGYRTMEACISKGWLL